MSTDRNYETLSGALRDRGVEANYDSRQGIIELPNHLGFLKDLYEDGGEYLVTYIAGKEMMREPSPPGSQIFSARSIEELAVDAADHIKSVNERIAPIRSGIRELIKEKLEFRSGRIRAPDFSASGFIQKFLRKTLQYFAKELKGAFEIEFTDTIETRLSVQTDFELYNSRQDIFYEGRILIYETNGEINIDARGSVAGGIGDDFLQRSISYSDSPADVDIVSAFRTLG